MIRACNPHDKQTALHRAVLADKLPNVSLLLRYDAECVVASDINGDTALHMACRATQRKVQRKIVETLLVGSDTLRIPCFHTHIPSCFGTGM